MNRMAPLIVRRSLPPLAAAAAAAPEPLANGETAAWLDDLRLFATGWVGGLVFFGTLFG